MGAMPSKNEHGDGTEDANRNSSRGQNGGDVVSKNPLGKGNKKGPSKGGVSNGGRLSESAKEEILGPEPAPLTEEEKAMIRETWLDVESCVAKVGVVMFIKLVDYIKLDKIELDKNM